MLFLHCCNPSNIFQKNPHWSDENSHDIKKEGKIRQCRDDVLVNTTTKWSSFLKVEEICVRNSGFFTLPADYYHKKEKKTELYANWVVRAGM